MPDSSVSSVRLFSPENDVTSPLTRATPLIVMWPGFGMGARYYDPMGKELARRGFNVATGELRGQGTSTARASREKSWGYHHVASEDYPATVRAAKKAFNLPEAYPTVFLCHSMGGQIGALFMARDDANVLNVKGLMGVGAGTPYHGGFQGKQYWRLRIGSQLMKAVIKLKGYQPEGVLDFSGYGRQAKDHVLEWIRYSQTNHLRELAGEDCDYEAAKAQITKPVLLTRCINDEDCPIPSCNNLAMSLPKADVEVEQLSEPLGHNRWAREPEVIANRLERFIREKIR
ncbi:alpha/beta fold hydrolase [Corynebacterium anserum]|uniref:Alpha/beta fold hydrolase n=2 Tax=Corynebacterium anserum TaxID=2684406 RepID=A0A7G7YQP6_9CORY|nr:alpha/beta fold hydrolase [Corynebacterium anserum]MBC2682523.1 alpha/beta fold hydrolase [Corynebacterium anserum]QNH96816.1 alpha/beta fold hydrolase [Corynebacterium anserum]